MSLITRIAIAGALAVTTTFGAIGVAYADSTVVYSGQGTVGGSLSSEQCNEAGDGYLLWVLTAPKASSASITGPWGTAQMTQSGGGAYKFVSDFYDLEGLVGTVSATHDGSGGNPQLVISHGCEDDGYPES